MHFERYIKGLKLRRAQLDPVQHSRKPEIPSSVEKMSKNVALYIFFALAVMATMLNQEIEARYLPARGSPERLEKLRELLKELLENEIEKEDFPDQGPRWHPESKLFYKREVPAN